MAAEHLVEFEDARRTVLDMAAELPREQVALDAALGRTLAEELLAPVHVPPFDNSAMDGFAVRSEDLRGASPGAPVSLRLVGESRAGMPAARPLGGGEAIAISTGAVLPQGADAVVPIEETRSNGEAIEMRAVARAGNHVRRAGEDVLAGASVLGSGVRLGAAELGVLGALGRGEVPCTRRPRMSVLVTGDELLEAGERERPGAVHDANSHTIPALARRAGAEVWHVARSRDDEAAIRAAISAALDGADVLAVCGGVSVGRHDHVRAALAEAGVHEVFWGIALKPGRPTWFGTIDRTLVFGLPGNPVSAMVTFILLVVPALRGLQGAAPLARQLTARLTRDYRKRRGRMEAVRCRLRVEEAALFAEPTGPQGSHMLTSLLGADGLALLPAGWEDVRAETIVQVEPIWAALGAEG